MSATLSPRRLTVACERFPIRGSFRISRGAKTEAVVVTAEITEDGVRGRGECVPYARYGETIEGVIAAIGAHQAAIEAGLSREELNRLMPAGAARNALDCALWDLEAKRAGQPAWQRCGLTSAPLPVVTAFTLSLDTPEAMAAAARAASDRPLLKLKLTGDGDLERVAAVRAAAPAARLIVDANEGWSLDHLERFAQAFADLGVDLIEQPLPAGQDAALEGTRWPVPLGADESCHDLASLEALIGRYQMINIKLDKTGGLSEALRLKAAASAAGLEIMVGCMVATSLAMAPGVLLAQGVKLVDLDGPLLLAEDRQPGLSYRGAVIEPPEPALWG